MSDVDVKLVSDVDVNMVGFNLIFVPLDRIVIINFITLI